MWLFSVYSLFALLLGNANSASYSIKIVLNNITNPKVSPYIFGVNFYQNDANTNYTICRDGGEGTTRFNWKEGAYNSARDWYFIGQGGNTWQQTLDPCISAGQSVIVQIPAMGWVAKSRTKLWSFSQAKYGAQQADECTNQPSDCTWCARDAGNGFWLNGSQVTGNDPNEANIKTQPSDGAEWLQAVVQRYGSSKARYFAIDNEPTLWWVLHFDVHPIGPTYDEIFTDFKNYAVALKKACNNECKLMGYSAWGWCGYFTDGYDQQTANQCVTGPDREAHGNLPLIAWFLQQAREYERSAGVRLLDVLDVHYYPQGSGVGGCDESAEALRNRLQAPRSLYDWSYTDPSWINEAVALIPRLRDWISAYYPGTNYSISEYNFGDDTCQSSLIAHAEVLSIFGTYGVDVGTRWVAPKTGSLVTNAFNLYTNYDGKRSNIYAEKDIYAVWTETSNIADVTGYTFVAADNSMLYLYLFNKVAQSSTVTVTLSNNNNIHTNGGIQVYGMNNGDHSIKNVGSITPTNSNSFVVSMPSYSIRLILVKQ